MWLTVCMLRERINVACLHGPLIGSQQGKGLCALYSDTILWATLALLQQPAFIMWRQCGQWRQAREGEGKLKKNFAEKWTNVSVVWAEVCIFSHKKFFSILYWLPHPQKSHAWKKQRPGSSRWHTVYFFSLLFSVVLKTKHPWEINLVRLKLCG